MSDPTQSLVDRGIIRFSFLPLEELLGKPPLSHHLYSVIWIQKGTGEHNIDFHAHEVKPNMLFFLGPEQIHQLDLKDPGGWVIQFDLDFLCTTGVSDHFLESLDLFLPCGENVPVFIPDQRSKRFLHAAIILEEEYQAEHTWRDESISAALQLFLVEAARIKRATPGHVVPEAQPDPELVRRFRKMVDTHYYRWHKVSEYADHLAVTPNHLKDVVKQSLGKPAKAYIQDRILLEAKRKAHFTTLSQKEIAFDLGFHDPGYFGKFFKNLEGMSFSEFKQRIGK